VRLRLAAWNVEWFNTLFDGEGRIKEGDEPSGREGVSAGRRVQAVTHVLRALDADAVLVVEAPDISRRRDGAALLGAFAERAGIRARRVLIGFANDTRQEIALLHDSGRVGARHEPGEAGDAPRFDRHLDLDLDGGRRRIRFSKPPLEAVLTVGGVELRLIGVHTKAKAWSVGGSEEDTRRAIESRRKLRGQCVWLRRRVEGHLEQRRPLVVLGDFNDNPGLDAYEAHHGRSAVELVMGEGERALHDPHARAAIDGEPGGPPTTARFRAHGGPWMEALLDYAMVSPDLVGGARWRIWHPLREPVASDDALAAALLDASDHFPVTLDLELR
jgi:hypothetical protein